ncbi:HdaA/DnaA family protein [Amphibiibacter pelophylacis]|uniref:Uncharacterized protein n=1 Tax=Amphibiibacter pelophylacis TaxID=1799477 RepID=A0ACC6P2Z1_9BURK
MPDAVGQRPQRQLNLPLLPETEPRLATLRPGPNALALQQVLQWLDDLPAGPDADASSVVSPLFVCGPQGSGKTHVLRALYAELQSRGVGCAWFDPRADWTPVRQPHWRVLFFDGLDAVQGDGVAARARQETLFALMGQVWSAGGTWVGSAQPAPGRLALRDDVRTRLASGTVCAWQPPGEADMARILQDLADERGLHLPPEVLSDMLARLPCRLSVLRGVLVQLDEWTLSQHRAITRPMLRQWLAQAGPLTDPLSGL